VTAAAVPRPDRIDWSRPVPRTVLLTGATGLVGAAVARELAARGHHLRVYARASSDVSGLPQCQVVRGELLDTAALRSALAGADAVVHVAGLARLGTHSDAELTRVNVGGVEAVLGAALEVKVLRAVVTSSTAAMGGTRRPEVRDESSPGNAGSSRIAYLRSKLGGERAALAFAARGLEVVVVRPSYVLGPGDVHGSSAATVVALARRAIPAYVEGGASFCDVRDVAHGHAEALERGRPGEVYVLGGHNLPMDAFVARVCALSGVRAPPRVPLAVALLAAAGQELAARVRGRDAGLTRDLVRAAALYTWVSSRKAERALGYRIRPFDEMVGDTLRDAMARGRLRPETPELRALRDVH
jgi:dihydroflavonol-4-reductase